MPDLKLSNHPSRAYDSETVFHFKGNDASFKTYSADLQSLKRTLSGLQNYFNQYCREVSVSKDRALSPNFNSSLER